MEVKSLVWSIQIVEMKFELSSTWHQSQDSEPPCHGVLSERPHTGPTRPPPLGATGSTGPAWGLRLQVGEALGCWSAHPDCLAALRPPPPLHPFVGEEEEDCLAWPMRWQTQEGGR